MPPVIWEHWTLFASPHTLLSIASANRASCMHDQSIRGQTAGNAGAKQAGVNSFIHCVLHAGSVAHLVGPARQFEATQRCSRALAGLAAQCRTAAIGIPSCLARALQ